MSKEQGLEKQTTPAKKPCEGCASKKLRAIIEGHCSANPNNSRSVNVELPDGESLWACPYLFLKDEGGCDCWLSQENRPEECQSYQPPETGCVLTRSLYHFSEEGAQATLNTDAAFPALYKAQ